VRRAPRAYPLPVNEEIEKFNRINGQLSQYRNVFNLGRVSTYEYIWIKDIVQQTYETRDEILTHLQVERAD
jgi:UDP-galactopyranose mutase